jgi:hypothetical protein
MKVGDRKYYTKEGLPNHMKCARKKPTATFQDTGSQFKAILSSHWGQSDHPGGSFTASSDLAFVTVLVV